MAKHGVIEVDTAGAATLKESSGAIGYVADAATSLFAHQKAAVGYTKWVQLAMVAVAGNAVGVHSTTGRIGVGAAGRNFTAGR